MSPPPFFETYWWFTSSLSCSSSDSSWNVQYFLCVPVENIVPTSVKHNDKYFRAKEHPTAVSIDTFLSDSCICHTQTCCIRHIDWVLSDTWPWLLGCYIPAMYTTLLINWTITSSACVQINDTTTTTTTTSEVWTFASQLQFYLSKSMLFT